MHYVIFDVMIFYVKVAVLRIDGIIRRILRLIIYVKRYLYGSAAGIKDAGADQRKDYRKDNEKLFTEESVHLIVVWRIISRNVYA